MSRSESLFRLLRQALDSISGENGVAPDVPSCVRMLAPFVERYSEAPPPSASENIKLSRAFFLLIIAEFECVLGDLQDEGHELEAKASIDEFIDKCIESFSVVYGEEHAAMADVLVSISAFKANTGYFAEAIEWAGR